ncbi:branched-chain amino acid aminotransferase [Plantactinospora sp. B5E13]|uniref:branched-chain amino acid aminotransferase n=1 Tax=unclassified Plantactinospora TaxID=2631981 RepID=UPI00325C3952
MSNGVETGTPGAVVGWAREQSPPAVEFDAGSDLAFGNAFTPTMVSLRWTVERGWHDGTVGPHRPIPLPPSMVGLHYGQVVFEGLKAFRTPDGDVSVFRLTDHARRFARSAARLAIPTLPEELFVAAVEELVRADAAALPKHPRQSLYLRPIVFADDPCLALRPARSYRFVLIAFVTEEFFEGSEGVSVWASDTYVRAVPGGVGAAKFAGNYAPGYLAQAEAAEHGCQQVLWLDAVERRRVEEMGGMNVFLVQHGPAGTSLVTPPLNGTILAGVTRDSLLTLARRLGLRGVERPIVLDDWRTSAAEGVTREAFACGTAAVLTPIRQVVTRQGAWTAGADPDHPVTSMLRRALTGIQRGPADDPYGWRHVIRSGQAGTGVDPQ